MNLDFQATSDEALHRTFRWQVPEHFNIAADVCGRWADERSRFALYYEDEVIRPASSADAGIRHPA
jgi:hypothetical protein